MRVRIARDELRRVRELAQTIEALEARSHGSSPRSRRSCFSQPGFGPLTAAKLVGEIAGAGRFASDAKLARAAGVAPIPVGSGNTNRHRLDRGGNRQINATILRIAVTRLRCHAETQDYIARKRAACQAGAAPAPDPCPAVACCSSFAGVWEALALRPLKREPQLRAAGTRVSRPRAVTEMASGHTPANRRQHDQRLRPADGGVPTRRA